MGYKNMVMARLKKFSERTVLAFPPDTFSAIAELAHNAEDRSEFIREAVELEIGLRRLPDYPDLKRHLLVNESVIDFCLRAISRAVQQRKAALAGEEWMNSGTPPKEPP